MKANLKGLGGIKGLLLRHGEKLGIAVVGLLALWFVYSSLGLPRLEDRYQATNLQQEISQTNATVQDSKWPDPKEEPELAEKVRYAKEVAKNAAPVVEAGPYEIGGYGFTPVIPPTQRRTDPVLLGAVDVRAHGGTGQFAFVDEEILKQQRIAEAAAEAERAKEAEKLAQQQQKEAEQGRRGRRPGRDLEQERNVPLDPEHPNRRPVQGITQAAGVPLQGGERIERAYWATVVAKVPVREQLKLYQDAFQNARGYDPTSDFPRYVGYLVERSEVEPGKPLKWERVPVYDGQRKSVLANDPVHSQGMSTNVMDKLYERAQEYWAGGGLLPEPVAPQYLGDPVLTFPLPPLVGRDWGADVTHPDIPLAVDAPPMEEDVEMLSEQSTEQPGGSEGELTFRSAEGGQTPYGPGSRRIGPTRLPRGGFGERGMPLPRGMALPRGIGGMGGEFGGRYPGPEGGSRPSFGAGIGRPGERTTLPRGVDFQLLRFFDFTVEPGKKYKYRVKLILADPNYGVDKRNLSAEVLDRKVEFARMVDEWSEPSPTVGIPLSGMVYVAEAEPASDKKFNDEPVAKLMVETFDVDSDGAAIHIAKEKEFRRGYVINLNEEMEYIVDDKGLFIDTFDKYKVHTGVTLLDAAGGDRLTKDMSAPSRVLLMGTSGELSIRDELDDSTSVEYLHLLFAEPDKRRGGEFGPMPPGPAMMRYPGSRER